ncbi:MAG: MBL fold metallo-hydrolase [Leptolyngbyaceae cyanobacterium]
MSLTAAIATFATIVGLQLSTPAQTPTALTLEVAGLTVEELADGVYGLIASTDFPPAEPATTAICNGGIVIGSDGVLVVDPFHNEALATLLYETVASLTEQPIRYVVNSHYHFAHTGGTPAGEALGYATVGRGPIRDFMLTRNMDSDPNPTPPDVIVNGPGELWLGDRAVQLAEFEGHTGGTDLVVYVPDADVLMMGDLLFTQRLPYAADGNLRVWQTNLEQLGEAYPTATVMPGHGPISDRADFDALKDYLAYLETLALDWKEQGLSEEDANAQPTIADEYADYLFQGLFPSNLSTAYQQITLGQDDAASIQDYFARQPAEFQAL